MDSLAEQIMVDIITHEMDLPENAVWLRDQNRKIPNDSGLYVIVGFVDGQVISSESEVFQEDMVGPSTNPYFCDDSLTDPFFSEDNQNDAYFSNGGQIALITLSYFTDKAQTQAYYNDDALADRYATGFSIDTQQVESSRVQMRENIQISILSRDTQALMRHWEIVAAMQSIYSQQKQEANFFKIFRVPTSFLNASDAEGGSNINRFSITVPCFVWYEKERVLTSDGGDYYDDFTTRVDNEQTIGTPAPLFEFEITGDTINGYPSGQ